ncbi:chorismate mutase [uncultured Gammaproteobacteria bacterium]
MPLSNPTLEDLRREIDRIDDAIHDLLIRRAQTVERIATLKTGSGGFLRPAREAAILRRLIARHTGPFPKPALVRIWREMISGLTRMQGPFAVAVYAPEDRRGHWDIARDHFGGFTPMAAVNSPLAAIRAVTEGGATVGIVPFPSEDDVDPWWRLLAADDGRPLPRVVARLPFGGRGNARGDAGDALAIACVAYEPTGDDRSLIRLELSEDLSRSRLKDALAAVGLAPIGFYSWQDPASGPGLTLLIEVADYVTVGDRRLPALYKRLGETLRRIATLGGYAVPLDLGPGLRQEAHHELR